MKFAILSFALGSGAAFAQTPAVKPGTIATVSLSATIATESVVTQNLSGGAKRKTYTTGTVRLLSRDILEAMRTASLLDGNIKGWTLSRLANTSDVGNLYATKAGKTAVAVPATLLTQPVVQSYASTGTVITPATGAETVKLKRQAYATLTVRGGASNAAGNQKLVGGGVKIGSQVTPVLLRSESYSLIGKAATGNSVIGGTYTTSQSSPINLTPLLPGATAP